MGYFDMMRSSKLKFVSICTIIAISIGLAAAWFGARSSTDKPLDESAAVTLVDDAIVTNRLTTLPLHCLALSPSPDGLTGYLVTVRELHSKECGGDPNTSPRLFSIKVDGASKALKLEQIDGTEIKLK